MNEAITKLKMKLEEDKFIIQETDEGALKVVFNAIGNDNNGIIVFECSKIPLPEVRKFDYYLMYSTISVEITEEKYQSACYEINEMNASTLIGSYGLVLDSGVAYHKYVCKLPKNNPSNGEALYDYLVDILAIIDNDYSVLSDILF